MNLKKSHVLILLMFSFWVMALVLAPIVTETILYINFGLLMIFLGLQVTSSIIGSRPARISRPVKQPFVSIHIPTYNEPSDVVINTLKALENLDYENYEVIILDNNTKDPVIWKPVEEYCKNLNREKFKFCHIENLEGYKAGALNVCHNKTSQEAEYILVIDADYQVSPNILKEALGYFSSHKIGLVQFPQAYFNTGEGNRGMVNEYEHFFKVYMQMANQLNCVLSTGTVSVIRKKALEEVGYWKDTTITEDVELGLRLHQKGYRGVYVPKALGKGLMPSDTEALQVQRERWVYGNMQTLKQFLTSPMKNINWVQKIGIVVHLTAWFNYLLIPILTLFFAPLLLLGGFMSQDATWTLSGISITTIGVYLIGKFIFFLITFRKHEEWLKDAASAYFVHLGLIWEGALSWWLAMVDTGLAFKRTNKFPMPNKMKPLLPSIFIFLVMLMAGTIGFSQGAYILGSLCILISPVFLSIFYLRRQLGNTAEITKKINK